MALLKFDKFTLIFRKQIEGSAEEVLSSDEYRRQIRRNLAAHGSVESLDDATRIPVPDNNNNDTESHSPKLYSAALGLKEQIATDLKQAKEVGQLRAERVRKIVSSAVSQAAKELVEGSSDLSIIAKEALQAAIAGLRESGSVSFAEITASIKGVIDGMSGRTSQIKDFTPFSRETIEGSVEEVSSRDEYRRQILMILAEEKELNELEEHIESILAQFTSAGAKVPADSKQSIESTIDAIKNSSEADGVTITTEALPDWKLDDLW